MGNSDTDMAHRALHVIRPWEMPRFSLQPREIMIYPDPSEVLELGNSASRLLEDLAFITVFNTRSNFHTAALLGSTPEAKETREWHFTMVRAYQELHSELQGLINTAEMLRAQIEHKNFEDTE